MESIVHGIVRGKNIELDQATPLPDGVPVTVHIYPRAPDGEGIRASAGAWAEAGAEFDEWLEEVYRGRQARRIRP